MKKKILFSLIVIFLFCAISAPSVYANSPPPPSSLEIVIENYSEAAVYCDLLIKIEKNDPDYAVFNSHYGEKLGIQRDSEIAQYNEDGFVSYTFHFRGASSHNEIKIYENDWGPYAYGPYFADTDDSYVQFENFISEYTVFKIALLDIDGNIIQISNEVKIKPNVVSSFRGYIKYDAESNVATPGIYTNSYLVFGLIIMGSLRIWSSIGLELLVAIPFKIKPKRKILVVNLATQFILTVVVLTGMIKPYWLAVLIMEAVVYAAEYFAYTKLFKDISKKTLLIYTIVANTVSLLIGWFLTCS